MRPALRFIAPSVLALLLCRCARRETPPPPRSSPDAPARVEPSVAPPNADPPGTYMGRSVAPTMSYEGAEWLDRPDREASERPEHVLDVLAIAAGSTVADVGAGTGYFALRLARRVGPRGRVLATDLQPEMLDALRERAKRAGATNVTTILATPTDAHLPAGEVDLVLMVDVYHELSDPKATLAQIRAALRPTGRLALVEYRGEDPAVPIKPEHKMTLAQIRRELSASGFRFVSSDESLPDQRVVVFSP